MSKEIEPGCQALFLGGRALRTGKYLPAQVVTAVRRVSASQVAFNTGVCVKPGECWETQSPECGKGYTYRHKLIRIDGGECLPEETEEEVVA